MVTLQNIETRIKKIEARNKRVELDKEWETSAVRRILIAILTYIVISLFFFYGGFSKPWINSIVPTLGFLLSTLSLSILKRVWIGARK